MKKNLLLITTVVLLISLLAPATAAKSKISNKTTEHQTDTTSIQSSLTRFQQNLNRLKPSDVNLIRTMVDQMTGTAPTDTLASYVFITLNVIYANDTKEKPKSGTIQFRLYPDRNLKPIITNFTRLIETNAYDNVLFHRVINNFMIQTGDPTSVNAAPGTPLGSNNVQGDSIIPMPFIAGQLSAAIPRYHKYGAVAVARVGDSNNIMRTGSTSQFYIVTDHTPYSPEQLQQFMMRRRQQFGNTVDAAKIGFNNAIRLYQHFYPTNILPPAVANSYAEIGGAPYLDEDYTVIGEVVKGMDIVEAIQQLTVDSNDRPIGYARIVSASIRKDIPKIRKK